MKKEKSMEPSGRVDNPWMTIDMVPLNRPVEVGRSGHPRRRIIVYSLNMLREMVTAGRTHWRRRR